MSLLLKEREPATDTPLPGRFPETFPQDRMAYRRAISDWCVRVGRRCCRNKQMEQALQWAELAATVSTMDCSPLACPELEELILQVADSLPCPHQRILSTHPDRLHWLHVVTIALPYGGHTAMLRRWIDADNQASRHSVALIDQTVPVPELLSEAVSAAEGEVLRLDPELALSERAVQLREYVWQRADVVVMHIYPYDVVALTALGVAGGPPVMYVNHAAHAFWLGPSIADRVLNCGSSELDDAWSAIHRGVGYDRCERLPIPLVPILDPSAADRHLLRMTARLKLGIPPQARVILTVGNTFKYAPRPGLDFLETAASILADRPEAILLAVGIDDDPRWQSYCEATGGRLRAMGKQYHLQPFHAAADVYVEGFPFGSTTALLEAGLSGLPCVRSPEQSPLPFCADGIALDQVPKPADVGAYVRQVLAFLDDPDEARQHGNALSRAIKAHHCGPGWLTYLERVKESLPREHRLYALSDPPRVDAKLASFWAVFSSGFKEDELVELVLKALKRGLKPEIDWALVRVIIASRSRRSTNLLLNLLVVVTGLISRVAPALSGSTFWREQVFVIFRNGGLIHRLYSGNRLKRWLVPDKMDVRHASE